mgnify:CR=1 FL=1
MIGALPLAQAAAMALLLRRLLAVEPARRPRHGPPRARGGAALAFVTVAIPLQLGSSGSRSAGRSKARPLAWLYRRIPHRGLLLTRPGCCRRGVRAPGPQSRDLPLHAARQVRIFNWYLYAYLVCAAALVVAGRLSAARRRQPRRRRAAQCRPLRSRGAGVLLFLLLNIEIADFYADGAGRSPSASACSSRRT